MAKKSEEMIDPNSCFNRAAADEPIFVLRGKDRCAAFAVRQWGLIAEKAGSHAPEKIAEARAFADEMEAYANELAAKAAVARQLA